MEFINYEGSEAMQTLGMLLKDKKSSTITSVAPTMTVSAAVKAMNDANVGAAVVLEQQELVGILTERDIMVRVVGEGRDPHGTAVFEVMTSSVYTATPTTSIREAMKVMSERRYRHLPVMEGDVVCGLISMGDVTSWIIRQQADEFDNRQTTPDPVL
jgi:CBS domain-containing protein